MKWHRFGTFVLVVLLLVVAVNPVTALSGSNNNTRVAPALGVGYVILDSEAIIEILAGGAVIGAAWTHVSDISVFLSGFYRFLVDVMSAFTTFLTQGSTHTTVMVDGYTVDMCKAGTKECTDAMHRFDYADDKNKGLPVGGVGNNYDGTGHSIDPKWKIPLSSYRLFHNKVDRANDCPKQIRYYGKDGKPELDIDFSHGDGKDQCVKDGEFPHKHYWRNGQRGDHLYEGIDEIIRNWKCKKYNFKKGTWCP